MRNVAGDALEDAQRLGRIAPINILIVGLMPVSDHA
jgi:hypothetical protein